MKKLLLLLLALLPVMLMAQRVSRDYRDCPMPQVLTDLGKAATGKRIIFIYNDLEDYTVTQHFDSLSIADAIRTCIGFYPISLTLHGDSILLVECMQKSSYRLIGRFVDERGLPVSYANITLVSPADSSIINKGVSNQNGQFVIPTDSAEVIVRVSHVAFKSFSRKYEATDIGTIRLTVAVEQLDNVTATPSGWAESEYFQLSRSIEQSVWEMALPQFHIDTIPAKYASAPAVVIAEYDSIAYRQAKQSYELTFSKKSDAGRKWLQTEHLHRTRYLVNDEDGARRLSVVTYSTLTDITNYVMYKLTVMGIRIVRPDGSLRTIDTFPYFKPGIHPPAAPTTDTIHIGRLEPGDILDVFVYHRYEEPLSPYCFRFPWAYPTLNYEAIAVADTHTLLDYQETGHVPQVELSSDKKKTKLSYRLTDCNPIPADISPSALVKAVLISNKSKTNDYEQH